MTRFRSAWNLLLGVKIHISSSGSTTATVHKPLPNPEQQSETVTKTKKEKTKRSTPSKALVVASKKVGKIVPSRDLEMSEPKKNSRTKFCWSSTLLRISHHRASRSLCNQPFHFSYLCKNYLHPYYRNQWIGMGLSTCSWHIRAVNATVWNHFATWVGGTPLCSTWFGDQELFLCSCGNRGEDK